MSHHNENIASAHVHDDHAGMDKKGIWRVFFILLALTALEFLIALGFVHHWGILHKGPVLNAIYIVLTLVKAFYIVAYFMHLKFEKSGFIICCSIVFLFIIYFIILLLIEGEYLLHHLQGHPLFPHS